MLPNCFILRVYWPFGKNFTQVCFSCADRTKWPHTIMDLIVERLTTAVMRQKQEEYYNEKNVNRPQSDDADKL